MKKRPAIGLAVSVLILSVIIGIASLPDEVLNEPSTIEGTQTTPENTPLVPTLEESQKFVANAVVEKDMDAAKAEIDALKQDMKKLQNELVELKTDSQAPDTANEVTEVKDMPPKADSEENSEGKVITINIKDGVGSKSR
jgi:hypothetical protein